jgi:tetratricopeptide (TPR) repeat protein
VQTNYLLHLLFYETKFRWAVIACFTIFIVLGVMLPKVYTASPPHLEQTIKVSGLDMLQAASLRRSAKAAEAGGRFNDAIPIWLAALANNQASVESVRGFVGVLTRQPIPDRAWLAHGRWQSLSLLRLTRTNAADLDLAVRFHALYDQHEWIVAMLEKSDVPVGPSTTTAYLGALFLSGQTEKFAQAWNQRGSSVAGDAAAALYHAAWQAGWGPAGEAPGGRARLESALEDPASRRLALSLLVRVHHKTLDLVSFEKRLAELTDLHHDTIKDQMLHWQLLEVVGRKADAAASARSYTARPQTPGEAEQLLAVFTRLGLYNEGLQIFGQQMDDFKQHPVMWVRMGELLAAGKLWESMRSMALEVRQDERLKEVLGNYGWFLMGMAEHGLGHPEMAKDAFATFVALPPPNPMVAFQSAVTLNRLGYPESAAALLKRLESVAGAGIAFWKQAQLAAFESRQAELLLAACEKMHAMAPDTVNMSNLAAALLMMRERPADAVQLTLDVTSRAPDSQIARVNHALALVQNGRTADSERILRSISATGMSDGDRTMLAFGWFQCHLQAGRTQEALTVAEKVDLRHLFPPQIRWFETAREGLKKS